MNVHILLPMPDEAYLRQWEAGITQTLASVPIGPVRDPAFMEREPNPVVAIRAEGGGVIWRDYDDPEQWELRRQVAATFEVPLYFLDPVRRTRDHCRRCGSAQVRIDRSETAVPVTHPGYRADVRQVCEDCGLTDRWTTGPLP